MCMPFKPFRLNDISEQFKNNEKERLRLLLKEISEEDTAKAEQDKESEFKIDGTGFYETRDKNIICIYENDGDEDYPWNGYEQCDSCGLHDRSWAISGHYSNGFFSSNDIVKKLTIKEE